MEIYKSQSDQPIIDWQWYEPSLRNITWLILRHVPADAGQALEVGCGTGRVAFALAERGWRVDALDVDERAIQLAREINQTRNAGISFQIADFGNPQAELTAGYDLIVSSEVLEHLENYRPLIANMYHALKPGGRLIITVPCDPAKWSVLDEYGGHVRRFTVEQMEKDLAQFTILRTIVTGFPFYRLLTRAYLLKIRLLRQQHSNEALWEQPSTRTIAALLYPFMRLDNFFAFTRLGDALIVVAEKKA